MAVNVSYNADIIARDTNGNSATNQFTFNTWVSGVFFVEAEDYNFSAGGFIPNPFPNSYGIQTGAALNGTNGVDYFKPGPGDDGTNNNAYRPGDLVDLDAPPVSADVDHDGFAANGYVDYNISVSIQPGEWEDYTRTLSNATCVVYARLATVGNSLNPIMELDRLAAPTNSVHEPAPGRAGRRWLSRPTPPAAAKTSASCR